MKLKEKPNDVIRVTVRDAKKHTSKTFTVYDATFDEVCDLITDSVK